MLNTKQKEEQAWCEKTARVIARRFAPENLATVYTQEDAFVTALLTLDRVMKLGKPRNYAVTCAGRAIIDEVRGWLGRTGNKVSVAIPSVSLDELSISGWLPDDRSKEQQDTLLEEDSFLKILACLPSTSHRKVITGLFQDEQTERQVAKELGLSLSSVVTLKEEGLAHLRDTAFKGLVCPSVTFQG